MSAARDHFGSSIQHLLIADLLKPVFEDRPGLLRTVSAGRSAPPEMASGDASPLEIRGEKTHQWLRVTSNGGVEGCVYLLCIGHGTSKPLPTAAQPPRRARMLPGGTV